MTLVEDRLAPRLGSRPSRALMYLPVTALIIDLAIAAAALTLAVLGRHRLPFFDSQIDLTHSVAPLVVPIAAGWLLILAMFGSYRHTVFGEGMDEYKRIASGGLTMAALLSVICYLTRYDLARGFFALTFVIGIPGMLVGRFALRHLLHTARKRGVLLERVIIVGGPSNVDEIAAVLRRERWLGYRVVGALTPSSHIDAETASGIPVLGHADDVGMLPELVEGADVVFISGGSHFSANDLRRIQWDLEQRDVDIVVAPSVTDVSSERVRIRPVGGLPLVHLEAPRWAMAGRWAKRTFDVIGSACLLVAVAPLFLWAALWVRLHDHGPVFFRQIRTGRDGTEFACLKFRTMVVDAEARLAALQEQLGHTSGLFKMKDDPRITKPGRLLRRFSLDELPQLINVLRGDMSLVGPRPPLPSEVSTYDLDTRRRLHVRPGMTGLWQVSGRSDLSWDEAVRLDLYYVDNWSMLQDLSILLRTFSAVLGSKGAY